MNQNIWGTHLWFFLHTITFNYPINPTPNDKKNVYNFFMCLKSVLPCSYCRKNYDRNLKEFPIRLNSRKELVMWLIDLHNEVNGKEGKRQYTYEEVVNIYKTRLNKDLELENDKKNVDFTCDIHCQNTFHIFIYIFALLGLFYLAKCFIFNKC